ncbi:hypothetical protein ACRAWF_28550 [Streptomyces sp. L7]
MADGKIHYFISGGTGMGGEHRQLLADHLVVENYKKVTARPPSTT